MKTKALKYSKVTYQKKVKSKPNIIFKKVKVLCKVYIQGCEYNLIPFAGGLSTERESFWGKYEIVAKMGNKYYPIKQIEK